MTDSAMAPLVGVCPRGHVSYMSNFGLLGPGARISVTGSTLNCQTPGCSERATIPDVEMTVDPDLILAMRPLGSVDEWRAVLTVIDRIPGEIDWSQVEEWLAEQTDVPAEVREAVKQLPPPAEGEPIAKWKARVRPTLMQFALLLAANVASSEIKPAPAPTVIVREQPSNPTPPAAPPIESRQHSTAPSGPSDARKHGRVDPMKGKPPSRGNGGRNRRRGR